MQLEHLNVKIFVEGDLQVDLARFIEIFHRWTAEQIMPELLIDVADYRHVPEGPGVVLLGHEADYAMDNTRGRWGLLYNRKAAVEGSNSDRLRQAFAAAAQASSLLEAELGTLRLSRHEFRILINDRVVAPNTEETWSTCRGQLQEFLQEYLGHDQFTLRRDEDPRRRFAVDVQTEQPVPWPAHSGRQA